MNRFCHWGMHVPGLQKIFNEGREYTRCVDCDATLIAHHKRWSEIPRGCRVVWRPRTALDPFFVVTPNLYRLRMRFSLTRALRRRRAA